MGFLVRLRPLPALLPESADRLEPLLDNVDGTRGEATETLALPSVELLLCLEGICRLAERASLSLTTAAGDCTLLPPHLALLATGSGDNGGVS